MTDYDYHVFLDFFFEKQHLISLLHSFELFKGLENFNTCQWERPSATFRISLSKFLLGKRD